jgi:ribosomal protein S18 acetylase RimI-like enzyme
LHIDRKPDVRQVRELFEEYSQQIGVDLCVQNFAAELAGLPDNYLVLMVARDGDSLAGCAGLRDFARKTESRTSELKRLYVREAFRGMGLGKRLTEAMIAEARDRGYEWLRLDTLPSMTAAIGMYRSMGFQEVPPVGSAEFPGQLFFQMPLTAPSGR